MTAFGKAALGTLLLFGLMAGFIFLGAALAFALIMIMWVVMVVSHYTWTWFESLGAAFWMVGIAGCVVGIVAIVVAIVDAAKRFITR